MTSKKKYLISLTVGIIGLLAPLTTLMVINREEYFTNNSSLDLSLGCIIAIGVIVMLATGKVEILKGITGWVVFFLLCYFLRSILNDMVYISGMALIGQGIYTVDTALFINRYKQESVIETEILVKDKVTKRTEDMLLKKKIKEEEKIELTTSRSG